MLGMKSRVVKINVLIVFILICVFLTTGCGPLRKIGGTLHIIKPLKPPTMILDDDLPPIPPLPPDVALSPNDIDIERIDGGYEPVDTPALPEPVREEPRGIVSELQTVYFDFDRSELTPDSKAILEQNAAWILENSGDQLQFQIQGHCDEQGTIEYNYSLGEHRANSVREYLIQLGVDPDILHTISYGEDRPEVYEQNEAAYAKNRRAQFLVYY